MTALTEYPMKTYEEPERSASLTGNIEEWRYDADGLRYRACVIRTGGDVLVAIEPDRHFGRTWFVLPHRPGEYLSEEYIAEKWRVNKGKDLTSVTRLLRTALEREVA